METIKQNKIMKSQDPDKLRAFLQELSWLLDNNSNLDFKSIPNVFTNSYINLPNRMKLINNSFSIYPNKDFLIGVLPNLFMDKSLFPKNDDVAQFASTVMNLKLINANKKSRDELIGSIVCGTINLNDDELSELVQALTQFMKNRDITQNIVKSQRKEQKSWNEIIQELANQYKNE